MNTTPLLAALCFGLTPGLAQAQTAPGACRPLFEAEKKQIMTPSHVYLSDSTGAPGRTATIHETISTGGVSYIMVRGKWRRSPLSPQQMLAHLESNLANTRVYSCEHVGDESANGVPATVYTAHSESEELKADARVWIAKSTGLPLRQEETAASGGTAEKNHISIRYEYADVHAPAVAQ